MSDNSSRGLIVLGVLLAVGLTAGGYLLGMQAKQIGGGKHAISVKGLAEKSIKADLAEWTSGVMVVAPTFAEALVRLRQAQPRLREFLISQGFDAAAMTNSAESVIANYVQRDMGDGRMRQVQEGYEATQSITLTSPDLQKIEAAYKAVVQFKADGNPVTYSTPLYLVQDLEGVKMSLIGAATLNAKQRADEFAKTGGAKVGAMRSASQGSFYVLPDGASTDVDDYGYGGTYDKTTVNKKARVVVTIEYQIDQ